MSLTRENKFNLNRFSAVKRVKLKPLICRFKDYERGDMLKYFLNYNERNVIQTIQMIILNDNIKL